MWRKAALSLTPSLYSGLALLLFEVETRRGFCPAQAFILGTGLLALLGLISYGYRALSLYRAGSVMPMALGTALGFGLWCLGALAAHPDRGVTQVITSPTAGGAMARRFLPMALLVPAMLGALRLLGEKAGYFETESGVSIFALTTGMSATCGIKHMRSRRNLFEVEGSAARGFPW